MQALRCIALMPTAHVKLGAATGLGQSVTVQSLPALLHSCLELLEVQGCLQAWPGRCSATHFQSDSTPVFCKRE